MRPDNRNWSTLACWAAPLGSVGGLSRVGAAGPELKRALLLRAAQEQVSVSEVIRRAIGEYLLAS